ERSRALEILDQRKGEMITVIMHEFRTPLGIVQSSADLLASGLLAEASAMERVADALRKGVLRLTDLVNQVRELALVSAPGRNNGGRGGLALTRSEIDLQEMFSQIERQFSEIVKARGQSFQVEVQKGAGTVYADAPLLLIVLDKLVSNAIRFTPDGGEIRLSAERRAGMVTIAVRDNGLGIEKSQQRLIYEKFYEVGEAMLHSSGRFEFKSAGLGVGLAVVQAILDQHASAIELDSTPGKGSKFYFSLPVAA
ncbi:MAG: HAMP domain-containing histidine kinase, partial [Bdellovibrionales bacterium]|nr:HAMP domain-containing histidine kinase [Bdellovibrionales bacterium]